MKIRKITADTMPEAMTKVKKEIGSDAVILYTRNINKKRLFGILNKKAIEVVVAIDELPKKNSKVEVSTSGNSNPIFEDAAMQTQLNTLNVNETYHQPLVEKSRREWNAFEPAQIKSICEKLIEDGVGDKHVDAIGQALLKFWYSNDKEPSEAVILNYLKEVLLGKLEKVNFSGINYKNKMLILLGPTGVGKTTTAAKLASKAVLDDGKSVGFITTDTYRIAAVDQLKTYAKILNVPVAVAYTMEDFKKAMEEMKDKDLIIVDSAGRNYQQSQFVKEIKQLIPFDKGMETHLVLSATAKPRDLSHIISQFHEIPITKCILTKVDETKDIGSILHLLLEHGVGVSYFTNGQNVPDDLIEAEKEAFIRQVIEGVSRG